MKKSRAAKTAALFFCTIDISIFEGRVFSGVAAFSAPRQSRGPKFLQNCIKNLRCCRYPARISMQIGEVYKLHSFSGQVYSFQQCRKILCEKQSKICSFFFSKPQFASFFFARLLLSYLYTTAFV